METDQIAYDYHLRATFTPNRKSTPKHLRRALKNDMDRRLREITRTLPEFADAYGHTVEFEVEGAPDGD